MAFIYCITNLINGKQYIGKTTKTVEERFKEHCFASKRKNHEKRPLYNAMNKYGIDNFYVKILIECNIDMLSFYEQYYILKFNTYKFGYNATLGGDGSILYNYDDIIALYNQGLSIREVSQKMNCCVDTVSKVLKSFNIPLHKKLTGSCNQKRSVKQIDNNGKTINIFDSVVNAAHWLVDNNYTGKYTSGVRAKISKCCNKKAKTAYTFKWEYC